MYFEFELKGVPIPEREIEEVITYVIGFIEENNCHKEVYKDKHLIETAIEIVVTNSMEGSELYYYYNLIQKKFNKEVYKRIIEKLKERGE